MPTHADASSEISVISSMLCPLPYRPGKHKHDAGTKDQSEEHNDKTAGENNRTEIIQDNLHIVIDLLQLDE